MVPSHAPERRSRRPRRQRGNAVSNSQVGADPATPVFTAKAGTPTRSTCSVQAARPARACSRCTGTWQREPYLAGTVPSQVIATTPIGILRRAEGVSAMNHFDIVLQNGAGGAFKVPGDYLFRDQGSPSSMPDDGAAQIQP